VGLWQLGQLRIFSSRQESRSDSAHTPETAISRTRKDRSTPCRHSGLTVICRVLQPGRLQISYVIVTALPNSRRPVLEGSSGVALMRNVPSCSGPRIVRSSPKQIQWNPRGTLAVSGGLVKPIHASRYAVIEQVPHWHWTHNRYSATRPVTGRQVIFLVRMYQIRPLPSRFRLSQCCWSERTEAHEEFCVRGPNWRLL